MKIGAAKKQDLVRENTTRGWVQSKGVGRETESTTGREKMGKVVMDYIYTRHPFSAAAACIFLGARWEKRGGGGGCTETGPHLGKRVSFSDLCEQQLQADMS